ncbi:MAG: bifunctional hydroxymethylpyrimidine kinase/phosphomethylpyrimidine kinase, partial [Opitutales bacterium]|nr:bifunctional hydroxymethylpyrimidine kinase/phosphomethylpyrimidine kinase [Opitutales bacterium]
FRQDDLRRLSARGIGLGGLEIKDGGQTFFWRGKYHMNFNRRDTIEVRLGVAENYEPEIPQPVRECPYVLLANSSPQTQTKVLDAVKKPEFCVLDTMNLWIETAQEELKKLIKRVDLLILNDSEAMQLANESNAVVCGDILRQMGAKSVIIKKGEHGAMLFHDDGFFTIPAYPVRVLRDPTGAGDSFAGALIGRLAKDGETGFRAIKRAMLSAAATASMTVETFSCRKLEEAGEAEILKRENYISQISSI